MVTKSYVGLTETGESVFRISSGLYVEKDGRLESLSDKEVRDFVCDDEEDFEYPEEWYDSAWTSRELYLGLRV